MTQYHNNKYKELTNQAKITQGLNIYLNNNYDILSINHIITDDKQLQRKGIDRITTAITTNYESITITVDDKIQTKNLLTESISLPYLREYTDTGNTEFDYIASTYKQNQMIALLTTRSQHLILLDHTLLAHTLSVNDNYLAYAEQYGYDSNTNSYYIYYNKLEARETYSSYSYIQYYYLVSLHDLLNDKLFYESIIDIVSLITQESVLDSLLTQ